MLAFKVFLLVFFVGSIFILLSLRKKIKTRPNQPQPTVVTNQPAPNQGNKKIPFLQLFTIILIVAVSFFFIYLVSDYHNNSKYGKVIYQEKEPCEKVMVLVEYNELVVDTTPISIGEFSLGDSLWINNFGPDTVRVIFGKFKTYYPKGTFNTKFPYVPDGKYLKVYTKNGGAKIKFKHFQLQ